MRRKPHRGSTLRFGALIGCALLASPGSSALAGPVLPRLYWSELDLGLHQCIQYQSKLAGGDVAAFGIGPEEITGNAVDWTRGRAYWTAKSFEFGEGILIRANLDGTDRRILLAALDDPYGIAVDPFGSSIYWIDQGGTAISRADLDGASATVIIPSPGSGLFGLRLDLSGGKIYWIASNEDQPRLRRANLDGSVVEDFVLPGSDRPKHFVIDVSASLVYWSDLTPFIPDFGGGDPVIYKATLDGTLLASYPTGSVSANGLALDAAANLLYWTDPEEFLIRTIHLDSGLFETIYSAQREIVGLSVVVAQPCGPDPQDCDGDGIAAPLDNCPLVFNPDGQMSDADSDTVGDACDNCPATSNTMQTDADLDGRGDDCDVCPNDPANDADLDTVCGEVDNCPDVFNLLQRDTDEDGIGDACDPCPLDPDNNC